MLHVTSCRLPHFVLSADSILHLVSSNQYLYYSIPHLISSSFLFVVQELFAFHLNFFCCLQLCFRFGDGTGYIKLIITVTLPCYYLPQGRKIQLHVFVVKLLLVSSFCLSNDETHMLINICIDYYRYRYRYRSVTGTMCLA